MDEVVKYWLETSMHDHATMDVLFKNARYSDALFFGHIVLEKVLKALVVKSSKNHAPFTHDLAQLQHLSGIDLTEDEINLLDEVNDFNIRARYPERKLEFYKQCTKEFTEKYVVRINNLYEKLCNITKS